MHDVIVDEERIKNDYIALHKYMTDLETRYAQYMNQLRRARILVICSGETAKALDAYMDAAKALEGRFDAIASDFEEFSASYVREVDVADNL